MAGRQTAPGHGNAFAANAVTLLLAAWFAAPVIAAPNIEFGCDDVADATLEISVDALNAEIVNHDLDDGDELDVGKDRETLSAARHLTPRAAATLREAFEDTAHPLAEVTPAGENGAEEAAAEELPEMNARVPGVTDSELARYRRQMYRIDI